MASVMSLCAKKSVEGFPLTFERLIDFCQSQVAGFIDGHQELACAYDEDGYAV
jgi:hypothetical protein